MSSVNVSEFLNRFISESNKAQNTTELPNDLLSKIINIKSSDIDSDIRFEVVKCLSYYSLNGNLEITNQTINTINGYFKDCGDGLLSYLINELKPMLLRSEANLRTMNKEHSGLKPKLGFSLKEDELKKSWKENGGMKSIPLFYVILLNLPQSEVSVNLKWIIPGILNILDDTSDLLNIKLKGVVLLRAFLLNCFNKESDNWISFNQIGMFPMVEPILLNLCYFMPPSYSESKSLTILNTVYDTLIILYQKYFNEKEMKQHLGKNFLSTIILQHTIPKIGIKHELLLKFIIRAIRRITIIMDVSIVMYLQRIIYIIGECIVRDPFLTTMNDETVLIDIVDMFNILIDKCPDIRIQCHKYDLLTIIVIIFQKHELEGKSYDALYVKLRGLIQQLRDKGCDLTEDVSVLLKEKSELKKLLN